MLSKKAVKFMCPAAVVSAVIHGLSAVAFGALGFTTTNNTDATFAITLSGISLVGFFCSMVMSNLLGHSLERAPVG